MTLKGSSRSRTRRRSSWTSRRSRRPTTSSCPSSGPQPTPGQEARPLGLAKILSINNAAVFSSTNWLHCFWFLMSLAGKLVTVPSLANEWMTFQHEWNRTINSSYRFNMPWVWFPIFNFWKFYFRGKFWCCWGDWLCSWLEIVQLRLNNADKTHLLLASGKLVELLTISNSCGLLVVKLAKSTWLSATVAY